MKTRLEKNILKTDSCWEWQKRKDRDGYGMVDGVLRKHYGQRAHRASYQIYKGEIPKGMVVMHTCDNRSCVNPNHLVIGTQKDNVRDCRDKGRLNPGKFDPHYGCNHRNGICLNKQV